MGSFKNPLAAAAAWAARMSDPEAAAARKKAETDHRRAVEAAQPPIPEAESEPVAAAAEQSAPVNPPRTAASARAPRNTESFRSVVWAGCIMVGVIGSLISFFIGMIR